MTREEAFKRLEQMHDFYAHAMDSDKNHPFAGDAEAIKYALWAMIKDRGAHITREQVEKAFPGCKYCKKQKFLFCYDGANDPVYLLTGNGLAAIESDSWGFWVSYCPRCGRPLTDEAVDMVMERLEALKDG